MEQMQTLPPTGIKVIGSIRHVRVAAAVNLALVVVVSALAGCVPPSDGLRPAPPLTITSTPPAASTGLRPTALTATAVRSPVLTPTPAASTPAQAPEPVTMADEAQARQALSEFFSRLHAGRYDQVEALFGGDVAVLADWNPSMPPDDSAALWKQGCEANGLVCLEIRQIVSTALVSDTFEFVVEFSLDDGTLFVRGPCCGASETNMPPQSQFTYTVVKMGERFVVRELPVYVP
jgi:hypothetical protein